MHNIMQDRYQISSAPLWLACYLFLNQSNIYVENLTFVCQILYVNFSIIKKKINYI